MSAPTIEERLAEREDQADEILERLDRIEAAVARIGRQLVDETEAAPPVPRNP